VAIVTLAILVLIVLLTSLVVIHHLRGARFVGTLSPIQVSTAQCVDMLSRSYSSENAHTTCRYASAGTWFRIEVRNVGHRMAYLKVCTVQGVDPSGGTLFVGAFPLVPGRIAGLPLDPGQTTAWTWFLARQDATDIPITTPGPVDHYQVRCPAIDYGRNVPI